MAPVDPPTSKAKASKLRHPPRVLTFSDTTNVVRHGEIDGKTAEEVWKDCVKAWTGGTSSEGSREELKDAVTQALVQSTSKDVENLGTQFLFGGTYHTLRPIFDSMATRGGTNDSHLRVFARSYEAGYFACAMFDAVSNPANVEARMELAARCDGPVEHAPYMIDVFDAVIRHSGRVFTSSQLQLYNRYRAVRTSKARESAQVVGDSTPRNDTTVRSSRAAAPPVPVAPAASQRISFPNLRD